MAKETKALKKYLTIHGHFYQPPRENPWLEEIEVQNSAYPFHDWNERINMECYKPNAFSKIFSGDKIIKMVNNYTKMSFNIGPTLLSWMEANDKETYDKILEADKISCDMYEGHGNAIAQVYNHIIMPLADEQDKETQIKWAIVDFKKRFNRYPEGMWLAETGIDYKTIEQLIENKIKFTILSPYQAHSIRQMGEEEFVDVLGGKLDATRPYRCYSKKNPETYLDVFFYDGPISNSIGFEDIVLDSRKYIERLKLPVYADAKHEQIISVATDGETYGHHKKFSELTLAHLLFDLAEKEGFEVTNFAYYLSKHKPEYEVIINEGSGEGTAWSCAHGVNRWKSDCGCNTGGHNAGSQKWRTPLRDGLNELRDKLKKVFEKEGKKYFKNIWEARNNYINIILDRKQETIEAFIKKETIKELEVEEKITVLKLLEMQRNLLLMFTSCGWFFDDVSGIETQQILRYAARAIQLAQDFTHEDLEKVLVDYLKHAKSNYEHLGTAKDIYVNYVKPSMVNFDKIVAHYAITSLFEDYGPKVKIYTYEIEHEDSYKAIEGTLTLIIGKVKIKDLITHETRHMTYGLLRFGNMDFRCSVKNVFANAEYIEIKKEILSKLEARFSIVESMRGIDIHISQDYYTFKDLLLEEKRNILKRVTNKFFEDYKDMYAKIYTESSRVVDALLEAGLVIPEEYKISAEYTISNKVTEMALKFLTNMDVYAVESEITSLIANLKKWKYVIKTEKIEYKFTKKLNEIIEKLTDIDEIAFENINKMYKIAKIIGMNINTNYAQFKLYTLGTAKYKGLKGTKKELLLETAHNMGFAKGTFDV